jgi:DNA-binding GntR family transcriptional regulator
MNPLAELPNLTELTYRSIKQNVLDGTFGLEARLTEEALSTQLGISKSPVREALNRLAAEGLVSIEARRGAYVRQFSAKEVADLYELRELLEVQAISLAVITPDLLGKLSASITRTRAQLRTGSKSDHIQEDLVFHSLIPSATGNDELCRVIENVQHKSLLCRARSYELSADRTPTAHLKIYRALRNGTRSEARAAMREHIVFVRDLLLASLQAKA